MFKKQIIIIFFKSQHLKKYIISYHIIIDNSFDGMNIKFLRYY